MDAADRQRARRTRRTSIGRCANELKQAIEARWPATRARPRQPRARAGAVDVTLPGRVPRARPPPPADASCATAWKTIFTRMGFAIVEGPEIEDEWHCFDALNMPAEHPARDMQDTLYLATPIAGESAGRRRAHAAAHAHLVDADPLHAGAPAADPHRRARAASTAATIST